VSTVIFRVRPPDATCRSDSIRQQMGSALSRLLTTDNRAIVMCQVCYDILKQSVILFRCFFEIITNALAQ